jgi:hypothetical protein
VRGRTGHLLTAHETSFGDLRGALCRRDGPTVLAAACRKRKTVESQQGRGGDAHHADIIGHRRTGLPPDGGPGSRGQCALGTDAGSSPDEEHSSLMQRHSIAAF